MSICSGMMSKLSRVGALASIKSEDESGELGEEGGGSRSPPDGPSSPSGLLRGDEKDRLLKITKTCVKTPVSPAALQEWARGNGRRNINCFWRWSRNRVTFVRVKVRELRFRVRLRSRNSCFKWLGRTATELYCEYHKELHLDGMMVTNMYTKFGEMLMPQQRISDRVRTGNVVRVVLSQRKRRRVPFWSVMSGQDEVLRKTVRVRVPLYGSSVLLYHNLNGWTEPVCLRTEAKKSGPPCSKSGREESNGRGPSEDFTDNGEAALNVLQVASASATMLELENTLNAQSHVEDPAHLDTGDCLEGARVGTPSNLPAEFRAIDTKPGQTLEQRKDDIKLLQRYNIGRKVRRDAMVRADGNGNAWAPTEKQKGGQPAQKTHHDMECPAAVTLCWFLRVDGRVWLDPQVNRRRCFIRQGLALPVNMRKVRPSYDMFDIAPKPDPPPRPRAPTPPTPEEAKQPKKPKTPERKLKPWEWVPVDELSSKEITAYFLADMESMSIKDIVPEHDRDHVRHEYRAVWPMMQKIFQFAASSTLPCEFMSRYEFFQCCKFCGFDKKLMSTTELSRIFVTANVDESDEEEDGPLTEEAKVAATIDLGENPDEAFTRDEWLEALLRCAVVLYPDKSTVEALHEVIHQKVMPAYRSTLTHCIELREEVAGENVQKVYSPAVLKQLLKMFLVYCRLGKDYLTVVEMKEFIHDYHLMGKRNKGVFTWRKVYGAFASTQSPSLDDGEDSEFQLDWSEWLELIPTLADIKYRSQGSKFKFTECLGEALKKFLHDDLFQIPLKKKDRAKKTK